MFRRSLLSARPPPPFDRLQAVAVRGDDFADAPEKFLDQFEAGVIARFAPFTSKYLMHCHNLAHEDHAMMANFEVV